MTSETMADNEDSHYVYSPLIRDTNEDNISDSVDPQPIDKLGIVRMSFGLIGLSQLIPWNFLITANDYWNYKFRYINHTNYGSIGSIGSMDVWDKWSTKPDMTSLQKYFEGYLSIATNLPFVLVLVLNALFGHKIADNIKNFWSFVLILIIFIITTVFVKINTDLMQQTFFGLTLTSIVLLSICAAFFQSSLSGIASLFPSECMHAMVNGQALSGLFAALVQLFALLGQWSAITTAFYYFLTADITLLFALIMYSLVKKTEYYAYHNHKVNQSRRQLLHSFGASDEQNYFRSILLSIWPFLMSAMLVFWVSLSLFPAITVLVVPQTPDSSDWTGKYFIPICCFLLFNLSDFMGRFAVRFCPIPSHNKYLLLFASISRIILIPLMMLCNARPRTHLPVLFQSEVYFICFITLLGFSNGFLLMNVMIIGPKFVADQYKESAGFFLVCFIGLGLALGSFSSNILLTFL